MKRLLISPAVGALFLFSVSGLVMANEEPDPLNGQKLFEQSSCLDCHGSEVFTRDDRKVTDFGGLEAQVRRCDANLSTNWFDDQIMDVVEYLNTNFYQFEKPASSSAVQQPQTQQQAILPVANADADEAATIATATE